MSVRIVDFTGKVLGVLILPGTILLADLEALKRLGAYRIEVLTTRADEGPTV